MAVRVQEAAFDFGAEADGFARAQDRAGAIVTFTGIVRDRAEQPLNHMEIEHYPGMTEKALASIEAEATSRWALTGSLIIHRYGQMTPGEMIMMVATAAPHRAAAFEAAEFLMDYLKSRAPFWKREVTKAGAEWVTAKEEDEDALKRW